MGVGEASKPGISSTSNSTCRVAKWPGLDDGLEGWLRGSWMGHFGASPRVCTCLGTREGVHGEPLLKRAG